MCSFKIIKYISKNISLKTLSSIGTGNNSDCGKNCVKKLSIKNVSVTIKKCIEEMSSI